VTPNLFGRPEFNPGPRPYRRGGATVLVRSPLASSGQLSRWDCGVAQRDAGGSPVCSSLLIHSSHG